MDTCKVYYFKNYIFYTCGIIGDLGKPPKLFLTPDSLTELKLDALPDFLETNIADTIVKHDFVMVSIASQTDTIRNIAFKYIVEYLKKIGLKRYNIRNLTEEERYVSIAKKEHKLYNPDSVEWRVGFDEE